ncbi:MAG: hypothetical protein ABIM59_02700 [candidate division WOR-3 bacterium]
MRFFLLLAFAVSALPAFREPLPAGCTRGIWTEGFLGMNFTGGTRQDVSLSGWGLNGGAGLGWWVHHHFGIRGQFRYMDYNFRSGKDVSPPLTYSYMGYGFWGGMVLRFAGENSLIMPYIGGEGGYLKPFHGLVKEGGSIRKIPPDSLGSETLYGGLVGMFFRLPKNSLWKLEAGSNRMGDDYLLNINTGFTFKVWW